VWGLYNEGMPECEFTTDEDGEIVFAGEFRTEEGDAVMRRRALDAEALRRAVPPTVSSPEG